MTARAASTLLGWLPKSRVLGTQHAAASHICVYVCVCMCVCLYRSVRLDDIIQDITQMGFERHEVMAVINSMQKSGQAVDLNVVIDRLTNGRY